MSETDLEIAELKESTRRLEAEINALIERSPALRKAVERERIEQLKARSHELLVKILVQQKNTKKKSEFLYLRGGIHSIVPMENERMSVLVNEQTAIECEAQRQLIIATDYLPWLDFNHEGGRASFYPTDFFWREGEGGGVVCRGILSEAGKRAVESGEFGYFSPTFRVDKRTVPPYPVMCLISDESVMGGITNRVGAFGELLKLHIVTN